MDGAARDMAPWSAVTRLAWALCLLSILLAAVNGESLLELIADHHAIGIMDALVLAPIGALIVAGDRRHLLAWLLLVYGVLTALLGAVYAGLVLLLGRLFGELGGGRRAGRWPWPPWPWPPCSIRPASDQVDLDTLSAELLAGVEHTMRPTATSLWLRPSAAGPAPASPSART